MTFRRRIDDPALAQLYRLIRRGHAHGLQSPSYSFSGNYDPVHVRYWTKHGHRLIGIMPDGAIQQRCDTDHNGMTDPQALACYERWYWQEMNGAAEARRHGFTHLAFRRVETARRLRRMGEREHAFAARTILEAAE